MLNQLFKREPTKNEFNKILECFNISDIDEIHSITYLSIKTYKTIDKLYNILDILLDIYLPCKYNFISNLNTKRCLTILRQIIRLYDCKLIKYKVSHQSVYKIERNKKTNIKIERYKIYYFLVLICSAFFCFSARDLGIGFLEYAFPLLSFTLYPPLTFLIW